MTKATKQIPKYTANPTFTAIHLPLSLWPCHPPRADPVTEAPIQLGVDDRELLSGPAGEPPYGKSTPWKSPDGEPGIRLCIWGGCGRKLLTANRARVAEGEPRQDAVLVVDMFARHLPPGSAGLKGLLAHRAVSPASGNRH
jgi:hypothetical protein